MNINFDYVSTLKQSLQYNDTDIANIRKSKILTDLISKYLKNKGTFKYDPLYNGAYRQGNLIVMGKSPYHKDYSVLAHELGHATGQFQAENVHSYKTAEDYSKARMRGEGEAMYYEFIVSEELKLNKVSTNTIASKHGKYRWIDKAKSNSTKSYFNNFHSIIVKNNSTLPLTATMANELGKLNYDMIASGGTLTYDEDNKFFFLNEKTNFKKDYQEVMGVELNKSNNSDIWKIKSLTNRTHYFFNSLSEDTNTAHDKLENTYKDGTIIAQTKKDFDVLYGGKGKDIIKGNTGKDIIIGGDDVDTLHGHAGDDILGGNQGDDHLYGGRGSDLLKGGVGNDTYHLIANDITNSNETDTIHDKDNQGKILIANVDISKAKWVNKGNGVFQAAEQKWQLKLIGTDWEITGMNGSSLKSKIIVKDAALTATAFGLTLPKAASASSRFVSANEHAFLASSISAANNLISAMSAFGVDNVGMADDLNARSAQYHAPLLAASAI